MLKKKERKKKENLLTVIFLEISQSKVETAELDIFILIT